MTELNLLRRGWDGAGQPEVPDDATLLLSDADADDPPDGLNELEQVPPLGHCH